MVERILSFEEYKADNLRWGGDIPPCVKCTEENFIKCREYDGICAAWRRYEQLEPYEDKDIGVRKHSLKMPWLLWEDLPSTFLKSP
jgi:hypothetical protein